MAFQTRRSEENLKYQQNSRALVTDRSFTYIDQVLNFSVDQFIHSRGSWLSDFDALKKNHIKIWRGFQISMVEHGTALGYWVVGSIQEGIL